MAKMKDFNCGIALEVKISNKFKIKAWVVFAFAKAMSWAMRVTGVKVNVTVVTTL